VYLRPRGHHVSEISAAVALRKIDRPVLLAHGADDAVVPFTHLDRLVRAATAAGHPPQILAVPGGHHSWLYEFPEYRRTVASFLARALGGPLSPEEAGDRAAATDAQRLPDTLRPPTVVQTEPGGFRSLARIARPMPRRPAGTDGSNTSPTGTAADPVSPSGGLPPSAAVTEIGS
jgi:hypothetical protein